VVGAALVVGQIRGRIRCLHVAGRAGVLQRRVTTRKTFWKIISINWISQERILILSSLKSTNFNYYMGIMIHSGITTW
jgi:hypothetical protein